MRKLPKLQSYYQHKLKKKEFTELNGYSKLLALNSSKKHVLGDISKSISNKNLLKCLSIIDKLKNYNSKSAFDEIDYVDDTSELTLDSAFLENNDLENQKIVDKTEKFFRFLSRYLKKSFFIRPFKSYQFVAQKHYLYFTIQVRPNNIFANLKAVIISGDENSRLKKSVKTLELISSKNSSDYEIKFTRKNMKANVSLFLFRFLKNLRFLKLFTYGFIAINIISPKTIRKTILSTLGKSPFIKRFKGKTILINLEPMKAYNGCKPKKITRKKRKKLRLYK